MAIAQLPPFPATPYGDSRVRLDTPEVVLLEPPSGEGRAKGQLASATPTQNVDFYPDTGWRLKAFQSRPGDAAERQSAQAGIMRPTSEGGTLSASPYYSPLAVWARSDGASYGADNATTGDDHYELAIPAGNDIADADLAADRAAFPGPADSDASVASLRLFAETVPDTPKKALHFRMTVPSGIAGSIDELGRLYFTGPASQRNSAAGSVQGLGQYCARLFGDGAAIYYERQKYPDGSKDWKIVATFQWCPIAGVAGTAHAIEIITDEFTTPRGDKTGFVLFRTSDTGKARQGGSPLALFGGTNADSGFYKFYARCEDVRKWVPAEHQPVRFDHRQDARPIVQPSRPKYPTTGYIVETFDTLVIPGYPNARFTAYWIGDVPAGCSVAIALYPEDQDPISGTPLTPVSTSNSANGGNAKYDLPTSGNGVDAYRTFKAKVTLSGDGDTTPTVEEVGTFKDGSGVVYDVGESVVDHVAGEFQASGQDFETGREAMTFTLHDVNGKATALAYRAQMPFRFDVRYPDPGEFGLYDYSKRSCLFRGYVAAAPSQKLHFDDRQRLDEDARTYTCQIVGMHQRLDESVAPVAYSFLLDRNTQASGTPLPAVVSDVIRELLNWCGFGDDEIGWDVGDPRYPNRLFGVEKDASLTTVNATTPIGELAMRLARDYLGRYLAYCPNSSRVAPADGEDPTGMWLMVEPPYKPYRPLARFEAGPIPDAEAALRLPHTPQPDWNYRGRAVPVRMFFKGELKRPEAPEFNFLIVSGVTDVGDGKSKYTTVVPNTKSFSAIPTVDQTDPTDVNFVGRPRRLIYVDKYLASPEAVQFVARRLMDYAGRGRVYRTITSGLVLVDDPDDPYLRRKRPLRPNDCIVVRGRFCVVRSCAIFGKKDGFQMQRIECFELPDDPDNPIA